ncbi:MAG TPA: carboxyl transferase domain-containing protein [Verrucomicrobiae bacterium]|jgi:acetyl/propionyl-CoA carboxylase alpha subunit/enoyl-CoA hydratase/carnithine racemase|nr:carboxyl transferase domain-containing protein [Verrucomicrobiae bacterium]
MTQGPSPQTDHTVRRIGKVLIANRGEVAIRVARAANELGMATVAIFSEDDARSLHVRRTGEAVALPGRGPAAYLDIECIVALALQTGCQAVHPGYGFLSENPEFARRCRDAGLVFVGPQTEVIELFGDKLRARRLAESCGVPVVAGTSGPTSVDEAVHFMQSLGAGAAIIIKAASGGGGRGMRAVTNPDDIAQAFAHCRAEMSATGNADFYVERLVQEARHIEVQIAGDGTRVTHLWERECTLQRRHQKLVEVAPSPSLGPSQRTRIIEAALRMAREVGYSNLGTFEFLVEAAPDGHAQDGAPFDFAFIEANPRLQVEHTVTEALTGVDLVKTQFQLAAGATLTDLRFDAALPAPRGYAIQLRVNAETMLPDGSVKPAAGVLTAFDPPGGPGIRVDAGAYAGQAINPQFDSLLGKLVVQSASPRWEDAVAKAYRALCEFRIEGVATNAGFLLNLLRHPDVIANRVTTRFLEQHAAELAAAPAVEHPNLYFDSHAAPQAHAETPAPSDISDQWTPITAPMHGTVAAISVTEGDLVLPGAEVVVLEAMKMAHHVSAVTGGVARKLLVSVGEVVAEDQVLIYIEADHDMQAEVASAAQLDLDAIRPDLAEINALHALGHDAARPEAVARRRKTGQRTARENIADLVDPGSLNEYGSLAVAAQRSRRSMDDLRRNTPADGLITGTASINGDLFDAASARCVVLAYDFTVLAGTQGVLNHKKTDRVLQLASRWQLPVVLFAEGGGGRPGDTDWPKVAGLDTPSFYEFARLSGLVPRVGIVSGRCFAGNAALLGCCDVIIATRDATVGMGGPAMIEGGGLGVFAPEEVGPVSMMEPNGVLDLVVDDEAQAVKAAKKFLACFQGALPPGEFADQRHLRHLVPENRVRAYDIRKVIETLADTGSVLELRPRFGKGIVTALVRMAGKPVGLIANNPMHLGGAIDADAADKAARFMQLCDAFDLPMVSLCDTPGFMVGPAAERTGLVRHTSRMFVTAASMDIPFFTIVLRKGYGLGAQAMAAGSFHTPVLSVSWPTGEFGGMGLEGAVRLGFRKELEAVSDPKERAALFERMVAAAYQRGKAANMASLLEIDGVIDPAETRAWILRGLAATQTGTKRKGRKRNFVDAW